MQLAQRLKLNPWRCRETNRYRQSVLGGGAHKTEVRSRMTGGASVSSGPRQGLPMSKSSTTTKAIASPNRVTAHPGEVLNEEFLKPLGMSINALAIALRVPATRIGTIVRGERAATADTALRLARFFDTSPEFWMNLQAMHDLTKSQIENGKAIARCSTASRLNREHKRPAIQRFS